MKGTDQFKETIKNYLIGIASSDNEFNSKFNSTKKNIDDCIIYILNQVKKSGCNGFTDEEIFGMALHYYDEENIEVGKPINANVVVNHSVIKEPKEIARTETVKKLEVTKVESKFKTPPPLQVKVDKNGQASLF